MPAFASFEPYRLFTCKGILPGIFLTWVFLGAGVPAFGQDPAGDRAWSEQLSVSTLLVVYPTHTVKHARIRKAVAALPEDAPARRRATEKMAIEEASRDTMMEGLAKAFREEYSLGPVFLIPDTAYRAWMKQPVRVPLRPVDGSAIIHDLLDPSRTIFLVLGEGDRETGTGIDQWKVHAADQTPLPASFPATFTDGGHIGIRLLGFVDSLFR
ncbi:MAG: hypothetical protein J5I41_07430, partial [Saprospiraceae bacterium]|nr:hypothetical protein [Saprospiraceae bacterium]